MAKRVRVGVVGTGIGAEHIRALLHVPEAEIVGVCSAQRERAEAAAREFGIPCATTDYRDFLGADVDALVLTTPPALHLAMTRDAFAAGKHVFCEKPLAVTMAEAREMRDLARASGCVHMLNHHMRCGAAYMAMHDRITAGAIGTPTTADARITFNPVGYLRNPGWSTSKAGWFTDAAQGGGILAGSAGPHLLDMVRWCLGPVEAVGGVMAVTVPEITLADGETVAGITAPDVFIALMRFTSGAFATVRGIPVAHGAADGFAVEVNGTNGSLRTGGTTSAKPNSLQGAMRGEQWADLDLPDAPWDRAGITARFIHAIQNGGPAPAPNFDDGVRVQALIAAIEEAARTGQWVTVTEE